MKANLTWVNEMHFTCDNRGHLSQMDAPPKNGEAGLGPSPKEMVLNAMMGCTAMDVVSILKKMRQEISEFKMEVEAQKTTEHPIHFKTAVLVFLLKGNIEPEKAIKAVDSSLTKYCGVNYMISKTCALSYKIVLNDKVVNEAPVKFIEPKPE